MKKSSQWKRGVRSEGGPRRKFATSQELRVYVRRNQEAIESNRLVITNWDVSEVTDMSKLFEGFASFNQPLNWTTSNVTSMISTFEGCSSLNQPLNWNTSKVRNMSWTFKGCSSFNRLLEWDTTNVTSMISTFEGCSSFNQPLKWDTRSVEEMRSAFRGCSSFNQGLKWDTRSVRDMSMMFFDCESLESEMDFDMTSVIRRDFMFYGCGEGAGVRDMGMVGRRAELDRLKLTDGDVDIKTDSDSDVCKTCWAKKGRYLIHPPDPPESDPHRACGECIEKVVLQSFDTGIPPKCPLGCGRQLKLSEIQKTAFGRYARKASGHKQRAEAYRTLHRIRLADAHDARAREYALGAARVLRAAMSGGNVKKGRA